jgi:hypothetical protein
MVQNKFIMLNIRMLSINLQVRDLEFTDVPVLRLDFGQIRCARLNKTAGVAGLRRGFCD